MKGLSGKKFCWSLFQDWWKLRHLMGLLYFCDGINKLSSVLTEPSPLSANTIDWPLKTLRQLLEPLSYLGSLAEYFKSN